MMFGLDTLMKGKSSFAAVEGAVYGLTLGVRVPPWKFELANHLWELPVVQQGSLEGLEAVHHSLLQAMHKGNRDQVMASQALWRARLHQTPLGAGTIFVEPVMALADMVSRAAEPLLPMLAVDGNLVISCQSTREAVVGSSHGGRLLCEAAKNGLAFTISQRGLAGSIQAMEVALVLGQSGQYPGVALICAGDRWIDVYPRLLGRWTSLSDGAAAVCFRVGRDAPPNLWILNGRIPEHPLDVGCSENAASLIVRDLVEQLSLLVASASDHLTGAISISSPSLCAGLSAIVHSSLLSNFESLFEGPPSESTHFGAANAIINLERAVTFHSASDDRPPIVGHMVWDCDPSGLFGAVIVGRSALDLQHLRRSS
jgi:hypothetical protein